MVWMWLWGGWEELWAGGMAAVVRARRFGVGRTVVAAEAKRERGWGTQRKSWDWQRGAQPGVPGLPGGPGGPEGPEGPGLLFVWQPGPESHRGNPDNGLFFRPDCR